MSGVATRTREPLWSEVAIRRLLDTTTCPLCGRGQVLSERCRQCGADFAGGVGAELWDASQSAVTALRARQAVLDRVPVVAPRPVAPPVAPPVAVRAAAAPRSSATVQSVLAVAGAGLVAVAAIVFTFFTPDLTDRGVRNAIIATVTLLFLGGARVLVGRGLRFSAEAVGALGIVFVALDVAAVAEISSDSPWTAAAIGTLLAGAALATLAVRFGIRVWLWCASLALACVPVMFGFGGPGGFAGVLGWLGTAVAASLLIEARRFVAARFGGRLRAEGVTLSIVQLVALPLTFAATLTSELLSLSMWTYVGLFAAVAVLAGFSARHPWSGFWSFAAGGAAVMTFVVLPVAALPRVEITTWLPAVIPLAGVIGLLVVGGIPLPSAVRRSAFLGGAIVGVAVSAVVTSAMSAGIVLATLLGVSGFIGDATDANAVGGVTVGLAALAVGLPAFSWLQERRAPRSEQVGADAPALPDAEPTIPESSVLLGAAPIGTRWLGYLGFWYAGLAALTLVSTPAITLWGRIAIGLALAVAAGAAVSGIPRLRTANLAVRVPVVVSAHALVAFTAILSWRDPELVVGAGVAIVGALAVISLALPARTRFVHVGVGYAYALVVFATALTLQGVGALAVVCLTTSAGALVAIAATFLSRVGARAWYAILVVTSVPFVLGIVQVVFERSGWTALSTGLIFALALTLVITSRPGLGIAVRSLAAAVLVPSVAVVVVCLGAQLLAGSGSPVVLPVIAVVVAIVLPTTDTVRRGLAPRIGEHDAVRVRLAIEASTLITTAIAVALALVREAAGLGTTFLVLTIIGAGAVAAGLTTRRRYAWWLAGAAFTGALWCVWGIAGVTEIEPYLLPPAVAAALVGAVLTARAKRGVPLYTAGLAVGIVPLLALSAVDGPPARALGLIGASWLLVAIGFAFGAVARRTGGMWRHAWRLRALRIPTFAAAVVAAAASAVQGVRFGLGLDTAPDALFLTCLGLGLLGAVPAALSARGLRTSALPTSALARSRWLAAPAIAYVAVAAWASIERDWFTIWAMWSLMLVLLALVVVTSWRARGRATTLPPVWFAFTLAFVTAVVAWSPRELRVEWFSLPLGAFLLIAGALHLKTDASARRTIASWPAGWPGSWPLLGPGLVVMLSASIAATFTDPTTWRAILVIALALVAILVGSGRRLAAPFLIGIVVLPVENVLAFVVQIGRGIESMPWWITLAVVGAVLLIIAVTYERRDGESAGIAARLRDLG
ncbi:SCO7613 C-terminal domain-containing membrane protein [Microbacterium sp. RU33B]|uniref:SCO7613 C-terminal domain-containing membrane protein n=1 Tax=Microbacterium sp. RU33B TaxID=1907390 RepID=UPI0009615F7C|nr:hypothetical protein [Microbacterium sp. RU33B]SIT84199.1 hypothetical protein SAMN05880545_2159 [Microbacterium sp. RU33B]